MPGAFLCSMGFAAKQKETESCSAVSEGCVHILINVKSLKTAYLATRAADTCWLCTWAKWCAMIDVTIAHGIHTRTAIANKGRRYGEHLLL